MTRTVRLLAGLAGMALPLLLPLSAMAVPAITCHCFTDRSYDPARPDAADPYFLATTQNSLFATVFKEEKKSIVMKKQKGASSDDLWVAYWAASRSKGRTADDLLQVRKEKGSWKEALASRGIGAKALGSRVANALHGSFSTARLAEAVVDEVLVSHRLSGDAELAAMRKAAATNQEIILAIVLARKLGHPAPQLVAQVKKGTHTWGKLLREAKIEGTAMQQEVDALLAARP